MAPPGDQKCAHTHNMCDYRTKPMTAAAPSMNAEPGVEYYPRSRKPWRMDGDRFHLQGMACGNCGTKAFPLREVCSACGVRSTSGPSNCRLRGKLYSFSEVHAAPKGFAVPYVVAYVDLDDGVRLFGQIEGPADTLSLDQRVAVVLRRRSNVVTTAPASSATNSEARAHEELTVCRGRRHDAVLPHAGPVVRGDRPRGGSQGARRCWRRSQPGSRGLLRQRADRPKHGPARAARPRHDRNSDHECRERLLERFDGLAGGGRGDRMPTAPRSCSCLASTSSPSSVAARSRESKPISIPISGW